jgi:hypothetical protein
MMAITIMPSQSMPSKYEPVHRCCPKRVTYHQTGEACRSKCNSLFSERVQKKSKSKQFKVIMPPRVLLEEVSEVKVTVKRSG